MDATGGLGDLERLIELQAIYDLKGRRDHAVDQKDWDLYAALHTDDYVAMSIGAEPIVGGRAAADTLTMQVAGVTTVHHCHTPVIEFQDATHATGVWAMDARGYRARVGEDATHATGVWAMEDNLFWTRNGEKQWLRGFGFYRERHVKGADRHWRFSYRKLERTRAETSPGATAIAADFSGENLIVGA